MIDNYDSFTYNLVQYLGELGCELEVYRNDAVSVAQLKDLRPDRIVISPGPGTPDDAGVSLEMVRQLSGLFPILGVCLGHQVIGQAFGGRVVRAPELRHGKTSWIHHAGEGIFEGVPSPFEATRYHSLILERGNLPECLLVNAWTEQGLIMGLQHREYELFGVQFHPESVLTLQGKQILKNFLCCKN